jgi:Transposase IS66 family
MAAFPNGEVAHANGPQTSANDAGLTAWATLASGPLGRQSKTYAREGIEIDVSTLADRIGACVVALAPINEAIRAHVMSAERIHADDTTVPVLAKLKTVTGRIWSYVRDDRPFGGKDPPAATNGGDSLTDKVCRKSLSVDDRFWRKAAVGDIARGVVRSSLRLASGCRGRDGSRAGWCRYDAGKIA